MSPELGQHSVFQLPFEICGIQKHSNLCGGEIIKSDDSLKKIPLTHVYNGTIPERQ